jgi:hypothetical protein
MASTPRQRDAALAANGVRLLEIGAAMIVVGLVLALALDGTPAGIGLAIAGLGCVPFFGGLGMSLSALVSRRARSGKPFA